MILLVSPNSAEMDRKVALVWKWRFRKWRAYRPALTQLRGFDGDRTNSSGIAHRQGRRLWQLSRIPTPIARATTRVPPHSVLGGNVERYHRPLREAEETLVGTRRRATGRTDAGQARERVAPGRLFI